MLTEIHWWQRVHEVRAKRLKLRRRFRYAEILCDPETAKFLEKAFQQYEIETDNLNSPRPVHPLASGAD